MKLLYCRTLSLLLLLAPVVRAQPLSIAVQSLDAARLPAVTMRLILMEGGVPSFHPGRAAYSVTDNGVPTPIEVECPDSALVNSIALVLDNSGTMSGTPLTTLMTAAAMFIDSMRAVDETMTIDFHDPGGRVLQDLTSDKALLKASLAAMTQGGSTPLWSASLTGIQHLATRPGKKVCIIFTDGQDNASPFGMDSVRAEALRAGVKVYTIGFGSSPLADQDLADLANATGGRFTRIFGPPEILALFKTLASEISSPACTITWTLPRCSDSLHALHIEARLGGEVAVLDTVWRAPFRADTLTLRVTAPAEVAPNGNAITYIAIDPGLHTGLETSFRFLLRYDPALLTVTPVIPVTLGTMAQNTSARLRILRPGVLLFTGEAIRPAFNTGNLIGVRFKGVAADSSRPVILAIDSAAFDVGCTVAMRLVPDTIDVCQCHEPVAAWLDPVNYALIGRELRIPVRIVDTARTAPMLYLATLDYDAARMTPVAVERDSTVSAFARIDWRIETPGRLRIDAAPAFVPARASTLATVVFRSEHGARADTTALTLPYLRVYAQCCPAALPDTTGEALIEGICDRVMERKSAATLRQNIPNPAGGVTVIPFDIPAGPDAVQRVTLAIYTLGGVRVATVLDADLSAGAHRATFDASPLAAGTYLIVLKAGEGMVARTMTRVR